MTAAHILQLARAQNLHIATAESCTGGLVAAALTEIPGSSDVFDRGFVTIPTPPRSTCWASALTLAQHGAISEAIAAEMATGALGHSAAQLAVAITGIAPGPAGQIQARRPGLLWPRPDRPAAPDPDHRVWPLGRSIVRSKARDHALALLLAALAR